MKQKWQQILKTIKRGRAGAKAPKRIRHLDIRHPPRQSAWARFYKRARKYSPFPLKSNRRPASSRPATPKTPRRIPVNARRIHFPLPRLLTAVSQTKIVRALTRMPRTHLLLIGAGILLASFYAGYLLVSTGDDAHPIDDSAIAAPLDGSGLERGTPDFPTLAPEDSDIDNLGGWARVSPEGRDPVYAFADTVYDISVAVSQQPLPEEFQKDTSQRIQQLARDFGATEKITVNGTTVYIGSSAEGPQSLIFTKSDLLILIKSADKIPNEHWTSYIASFR